MNLQAIWQTISKSLLLPVALLLILVIVVVNRYNLSVTDYLVNKVILKLDAGYQPYGPSVQGQPAVRQGPVTTPTQPNPWTH